MQDVLIIFDEADDIIKDGDDEGTQAALCGECCRVPSAGEVSCVRLGLSWTSCRKTACRFLNIDLTTHDDIGESGESQRILI